MYTSRTTVHMIKTRTGCIYISRPEERFTEVVDRQQRREKSNSWWQTWVGGMLTIAPVMLIWARLATAPRSALLYFAAIVCVELCDPLFGLLFHYLWKTCRTRVPSERKAKREPGVRCYKLLARPVARPGEPDLAAPRLRRVKRCTQRSSLHLYAPYIGRLLLQPTGTWLLAS